MAQKTKKKEHRPHRRIVPKCLRHGAFLIITENDQILHRVDWSRCVSKLELNGVIYDPTEEGFEWPGKRE